ncbi:ankyrin [Daldinia eschscholtzii]|nr:ankyrin [Daldinia eschscholtzii]
MATKARKIPLESWELHKESILSLYLTSDLSMEELVQTMEKDHGFAATLSQFEAQLRVWKARKNLKKDEWERILPKLDNLSARGIKTRVVIAGHPVPTDRVHRAKRHFKEDTGPPRKRRRVDEDPDQAINSTHGSATIEIQDSDGNWNPCADVASDDVPSRLQPSNVNEAFDPTEQSVQVEDDPAQGVPYPVFIEPLSFPDISLELSPYHDINLVTHGQPVNAEDQSLSQTTGFQGQVTMSPVSFEHGINFEFPVLDLENFGVQLNNANQISLWTMFLKDLPFERFERGLLSKYYHSMRSPSPIGDSRLLSGARGLDMEFICEVVTDMTDVNGKSARENFLGARLAFQTLDTIIPDPQLHGRNTNTTCLSQINPNIEMCRVLLYSLANGLSGMNGIPLGVIPRFLEQSSNIIKLLPELSQSSPNYVAKGLAESLFRICIESGNHDVIRLVLKTGLVDVNEMCCFVDGEKYTPLERLAKLQQLQAIHELLQFKPNVNRTLNDANNRYVDNCKGALDNLINGIVTPNPLFIYHSVLSQDWLDTVDALIQAGAEVRANIVVSALERFARMDLAEKLLPQLMLAEHSIFISQQCEGLWSIADNFTDEEAEKAFTKLLFEDCERAGCKQCLNRHANEISAAIYASAERGHIQLVRSYFQYATCSATVLAAAISSGSHELITFILGQNPSMHPIFEKSEDNDKRVPLAEAIEAQNNTLVGELEARGALENLDQEPWDEFSLILAAATNVGDVEYVKKLLILYPKFDSRCIVGELESASRNAREQIMQLLLDAGVELITWDRADTNVENLFIRAYGNKPLLSRLISAYPDFKMHNANRYSLLEKDLESGIMEMLDFFARSGMLHRKFLTGCLPIAVKLRDGAMLRRLLELGADVLDTDSVVFVPDLHIDMLRILFEYIPPMDTYIPLFGTQPLVDAIRAKVPNIDVLDLFINCKAVDLKSITRFQDLESTRDSPLGAAIMKEAEACSSSFPLTRRLLDAGCDVNGIVSITYRNECFQRILETPLLKAIETNNKSLIQLLIDRGAQVNATSTCGIRRTPLQAAAEQGSLDIVELLLQNGADANGNPATFHGGTALQYAAMSGNCNIAALLLDHYADLSAPPSIVNGRWPIEAAAEHGRLDMIQFLWNVKGDVGFSMEQCRKAMKLAKENGHGACAGLIRELAVSNGIMLTLEGSE